MMPAAALQQPQATGWQAHLGLEFTQRSDKTVLAKSTQRGPLRVQRAFYPEGDVCHLYILHPPGGVVGGDRLTIDVSTKEDASVLLTTPGATKFYRSDASTATQHQHLNVASNGALEWLPQENIFFPGAEVELHTEIHLADNARLMAWETQCMGLPVNDDAFTTGNVLFNFSLYKDDRPILLERFQLNHERLTAATALRGHPVMSMMVAAPANNDLLELARSVMANYPDTLIAATLIEDCLVIRYMGDSTQDSREIYTQLWRKLRPEIMGRDACPPRIWAT